jgi:pyruvate dehydrogenase E2 component (dihydrolipoamide acetyltransferase)
MRHELVMPRICDTTDQGIVVAWFVELGTLVEKDQLIAEVQVEKTSVEIQAPASGRLVEIRVAPGAPVTQGGVFGVIEAGSENCASPPAVALQAATIPAPNLRRDSESSSPAAGRSGPPASPAARRLARELGVAIDSLAGSGPGGRIVEADVRAAAGRQTAERPAPPSSARREPLTPMRRAIADRLCTWLASTAQVTTTAEADVTALAAELAKPLQNGGQRISYTAAATRACALALAAHPRVAACWNDVELVYPERVDIGIAVSLNDGLIVPVVRSADTKDLLTLSREIADLAVRARSARLAPEESLGGVFSISNMGAFQVDAATPLLNPPQTAILGMGRARPRPAVVDGALAVRTLLVLSLTFDHRVLDGVPAATFLTEVIRLLEAPDRLFKFP